MLILPFMIVGGMAVLFCVPFIIWNAHAFFDSVIFYLSGNTAHGYPVSGYGLGMVLYEKGIIKNIHDYYPFFLWQAIAGGVALIIGFIWMMRKPTLSRLIIAHAASLLVIWYVSRYFNNSHVAYISSLFILGMLADSDSNGSKYDAVTS